MLNYGNLNDVEFEYLCQDIMSKKLGVPMRRFASGKDGGIDLADSTHNPKIIVQVKHYIKTDINGLIRSLQKEIDKVKKIKSIQYYICCSKELSAKKINEIYTIFLDYMDSDKSVITINEIDEFLTDKENIDVLRKHYKLWISSTNILQDLNNNDIFIDCESLLSSSSKDEKYFVQTDAYNQALRCLSKYKTLFLIGDPGVGKTVTSKMLILYYAAKGYRVRYTTDVTNLASLKRSLVQDRNAKEIILLDDCFGQAYFEMKLSQGTELLSLIRFVNASKNKVLILNSRVTIFQEARKKTPEIVSSLENKEFKVQMINMSAISDLEKAKILYNHMYFRTKDEKYFQVIKASKNYLKIIKHKNYNPRIIEFVSNPNKYKDITESKYFDFIIQSLDNPHMVWNNEYEDRIQIVDRCLLMTLYSLTNTIASYELTEKCFIKRLKNMSGIDSTINQFECSLTRLQESFIKIIDDNGHKKLSMVNPSVNDYLKSKLEGNPLELNNILKSAGTITQYIRLNANEKISDLFKTGDILELIFESEFEKNRYITEFIVNNSITNISYKNNIYYYLEYFENDIAYEEKANILIRLFNKEIFYFYGLDKFLLNLEIFGDILSGFEFKDLPLIFLTCYHYFEGVEGFITMCEEIVDNAIYFCCDSVDATLFDVNIGLWLDENENIYIEEGNEKYIYETIKEIENYIKNIVINEIAEILNELPSNLGVWFKNTLCHHVNVEGVEDMVTAYIKDDYDREDDCYYYEPSSDHDIDLIFNR
ncbi:restriction endonuclease [Anaerotignum propionicum]|uniref:nSTAND3 domain-containing NTPase n=1 Tax=Anaerotignum propionicum TaxID=28446 RepID=UPI00210C5ABB|nr:restriction endonuclease [Anaerotignum propionicum]MCQ4936733.1 restriction endonuclease [Anaerotignum propionicum]